MKEEKKKITLTVIGILLIACVLLGISYALWVITHTQESTNMITTDCFKIEFTDENPISLTKAYPMRDSEGMELVPYTFTLKNTCSGNASFQVNLETLEQASGTKVLPDEYVKVNISEGDSSLLTEKLGNNLQTATTITNAKNAYKLYTGILKANETKVYNVRLWMDEDITPLQEDAMNANFQGKVTIIASYLNELPKKKATETLAELAETSEELVYDGTTDNNLRYIGANPSNYVTFGETYQTDIYDLYDSEFNVHFGLNLTSQEECETFKTENNIISSASCEKTHSAGDKILWRIIGSMNNIDNGSGTKETRVKLIRNESIGPWSWDSSESSINSGNGVNEWSTSDIKTILNDYYYNGLSSQTCYVEENNKSISCDFSNIGMSAKMKSLISDAVWNTGSNGSEVEDYAINTSKFYELERSNNTGKICTSGDYCNDTITRTTKWTGKVGLLYPSDYGYATKGGETTDRNTCLATNLSAWSSSSDCYTNNWLYNGYNRQKIMTPAFISDIAHLTFVVSAGCVGVTSTADGFDTHSGAWSRPTVFLNANVSIKEGNGTQETPFIFE